jgi:hypothetical protein
MPDVNILRLYSVVLRNMFVSIATISQSVNNERTQYYLHVIDCGAMSTWFECDCVTSIPVPNQRRRNYTATTSVPLAKLPADRVRFNNSSHL